MRLYFVLSVRISARWRLKKYKYKLEKKVTYSFILFILSEKMNWVLIFLIMVENRDIFWVASSQSIYFLTWYIFYNILRLVASGCYIFIIKSIFWSLLLHYHSLLQRPFGYIGLLKLLHQFFRPCIMSDFLQNHIWNNIISEIKNCRISKISLGLWIFLVHFLNLKYFEL